MISFTTAFVAAAAVAGVFASPTGAAPAELTKRNSPNAQIKPSFFRHLPSFKNQFKTSASSILHIP
ncbi:uncharacterized protein EAE98_000711 [Botrytis deweyae]|uniref:Uncharacterized protein n=1 Tax=Botrytis deweyae TaxID=2478750 RepID=A0ABQ7J3G0_9HELO|nr:uncharacterized protein EAE98_000711 [Botrytis deweyae]KAF7940584.1 hypothetical protein EAE98_000711 [Botrytis deweyae]